MAVCFATWRTRWIIGLLVPGSLLGQVSFDVRPIAPLPFAPQLSSVSFVTATRAVAVGDRGAIFVSGNPGESWTRIESGIATPLRAVAFAGAIGIAAANAA
jgi:hypothetical protein